MVNKNGEDLIVWGSGLALAFLIFGFSFQKIPAGYWL